MKLRIGGIVKGFAILSLQNVWAFTPSRTAIPNVSVYTSSARNMLSPSDILDPLIGSTVNSVIANAPTLVLSETEAWVQPLAAILGPFLNLFSFAMLCRVVISWYPNSNLKEFPYNIVVWPTEPLLRAIRGTVPPAFGVDITPIVWLGIFTFFSEILIGQQGLLTMKIKYGI